MKKWCALCLAAMLCLSPALSCHAADGGADIPVYARYIRDYAGVYDVPVGRGHPPVETDDGVRVTAEGEEGIWLIVYPIPHTDEDARTWLLRCLKDYGTKIYPMEIFFVDENGNRVEPKGEVTITITPPEGFGEAVVCQVATDSEVSRKDSQKNGEEISFSYSGSGYYVLTQKTGSDDEDDASDDDSFGSEEDQAGLSSADPGKITSPGTSDEERPELYAGLLLLSWGGLTAVVCGKRKKRNS